MTQDVAGLVSNFQFQDGAQTRTPANSVLCSAVVSTNAAGALTQWVVSVRESPAPGAGNPQQFIDVTDSVDQVGVGGAGASVCDSIANLVGASNSGGGTWTGAASGSVNYTYSGQPFETFDPPYAATSAIAGQVTLSGALPPSLPMTDVSLFLRGFEFQDGVQTRTVSNSEVCGFSVGTDASGAITQWALSLREAPWPGNGLPQAFMDTTNALDQAGVGNAGASVCGVIVTFVSVGGTLQPGTWSGGATARAVPVI